LVRNLGFPTTRGDACDDSNPSDEESTMRRRPGLFVLMALTILLIPLEHARGELLVSGFDSRNVVGFDESSGVPGGEFVAAGSGGLSRPEGLGFTSNGQLVVSSFGTNQLLRYDGQSGSFLGVFAALDSPTALLTRDGLVYVSSYTDSSVNCYDQTTGT